MKVRLVAGDPRRAVNSFCEGDVGRTEITPCFENGKSTVDSNLASDCERHRLIAYVTALCVDPDYVLLFLRARTLWGPASKRRHSRPKACSGSIFRQFPFPLPPLAEQRRIVAKLDELMALCDRLEAARTAREATRDRLTAASLARLNAPDPETFAADARFALGALPALTARPDQIKQLRQTILNLAVRGSSCRRTRRANARPELLKRIAKEKGGWKEERSLARSHSTRSPTPIPN